MELCPVGLVLVDGYWALIGRADGRRCATAVNCSTENGNRSHLQATDLRCNLSADTDIDVLENRHVADGNVDQAVLHCDLS